MQNNEPMGKDENIAFRTSSETKQILERLAKEGYRSLSQQCEMIVLDWLKQHGHIRLEEKEPFYKKPLVKEKQSKAMIHEPSGEYRREPGK